MQTRLTVRACIGTVEADSRRAPVEVQRAQHVLRGHTLQPYPPGNERCARRVRLDRRPTSVRTLGGGYPGTQTCVGDNLLFWITGH
jgi:hypothetical protein